MKIISSSSPELSLTELESIKMDFPDTRPVKLVLFWLESKLDSLSLNETSLKIHSFKVSRNDYDFLGFLFLISLDFDTL